MTRCCSNIARFLAVCPAFQSVPSGQQMKPSDGIHSGFFLGSGVCKLPDTGYEAHGEMLFSQGRGGTGSYSVRQDVAGWPSKCSWR